MPGDNAVNSHPQGESEYEKKFGRTLHKVIVLCYFFCGACGFNFAQEHIHEIGREISNIRLAKPILVTPVHRRERHRKIVAGLT